MTTLTAKQIAALDRLDCAKNPINVTPIFKELIALGLAVETYIYSNRIINGKATSTAKKSGKCAISDKGCMEVRSIKNK